jgi:integrase
MPLTDIAIRKAQPSEKPMKLADAGGLYLLLKPNGSRLWRFDYRFEGKRKTIGMGSYPEVSLKDARWRRDDARRLLAQGIDPSAERQQAKKAIVAKTENTFEAVALRWWAEHAPTWSTGYATRVKSRLEADLFPAIGTIDVNVLTAADLRSMTETIRARGVMETARRALQDVGQVLIYADLPDISVSQRKKLPAYKVRHMPAITEAKEAAALLRAIDAYLGGIVVRSALRLAPLVFVRPGELRSAKWSDINLDAAEWRYHVSKTSTDHIVPLSRQAVAILKEIAPVTGKRTYVFPSPRGDRPMSENALRVALISMGFGETQSARGFRAMARTIIDEELHYPPHIIEQQLAHVVKDPMGRAYNRTAHLAERKKMMQSWADYLDWLKNGLQRCHSPSPRSAAGKTEPLCSS